MNAPDSLFLPDEQSRADLRNIAIQRVGIKSVRHPVIVDTREGPQPSVATIDMAVFLPADVKGTHMSRFLEILQQQDQALTVRGMRTLMRDMLARLDSNAGTITMKFPYFVRKVAPVSGVASLLDYEVTLEADNNGKATDVYITVLVPVTSLCPCSKKISEYGAHNQRSHITIRALVGEGVDVEDLIRMAEESASCELWGLLKRPDEKYVTEKAYENPKFVEDLVRDVAIRLRKHAQVLQYRVESENFESIHNHSAVAWIEEDKRS
ncbi:MAG TPA: GTP cyclohydrolase FolE2 [Limnobacter sp.]|uniref:GTP cyclohydrolase FolE2 n=1 Tax=Limnobacter sp. TaxID=2003368 RepID=UPI002ED9D879